jgi:KDO2-lipid IV(A) lauroyltransferase
MTEIGYLVKKIRFLFEAIIVWLIFIVFWILPVDISSYLGGLLARKIGYHLKITERARHNLRRFMKELSPEEIEEIILKMWDNLGRIVGEHPHILEFKTGIGERITVRGEENFHSMVHDNLPGIFMSAHYGNWELLSRSSESLGLPIHVVYRAPNNPYLDWIFQFGRKNKQTQQIKKGPSGAKKIISLFKKGEHFGFLIDQKMNDGVPVPFFGVEAMTAPAIATLSLRFKSPVLPARVIRQKGAHFLLQIEKPIYFTTSHNHHDDVHRALSQVNEIVERWIKESPEQWFWLHRRWPE